MKFIESIKSQIITEWSDFYINYGTLLDILKPLRSNFKSDVKYSYGYKSRTNRSMSHFLKEEENRSPESLLPLLEQNEEAKFEELFEVTKHKFFVQLKIETEKFCFFVDETFEKRVRQRFDNINEQLEFIKKNKDYKIFSSQLERAYFDLYRDASTFQKFIDTNIKIKQKIIAKYAKYTSSIEQIDDYENCLVFVNEKIDQASERITKFLSQVEKRFSFYFYRKYNMHPIKVLKGYLKNKTFTKNQAFFLGIVIGIMILLFLTCYILGHNKRIDMDDDPEFRSLFPMYRTFGILILYLWTLGLNVWAWNKARINYKALFNFDNHYSTVIQICGRAAFFTVLLFISIMIYLIIRSQIPMFMFLNRNIPVDALPLVCWLALIVYFFCPIKIWNYEGRTYTMRLFGESVASIFIPTEFRHIWFMDQLTSLIGPMRDIEYTLCYYSYYTETIYERVAFCGNTRGIYLFLGIFPNFIRVLQCIRVIMDSNSMYPQVFNIGKYTFNIIVCVFSFLTVFNRQFFTFWLISACISGCYSSFWDIKMDFGFLQEGPNFPLRNKLTYKNHSFYHVTIVVNVILRFLWVLSVSPEIMNQMIKPEFLALILFTLEMLRRGLWNFIRVEYEHLDLIKKYQISYYEELPFVKSGGEFIVNQDNLMTILNFEKEDKIKLELKQIFKEADLYKKTRISQNQNLNDIAETLEECLKDYKTKTLNNIGGYAKKMSF